MGYCTADEVFLRMGRGDTATSSGVQNVTDAIEAATAAIDEDCHRAFDLIGADALELPVVGHGYRLDIPDLISVTSIKLDDDDDGVFETTLDAADFELDSWHTHSNGFVDLEGDRQAWPYEFVTILTRTWPTNNMRRRVVEIDGSWGWPTVPAAINQACSILATRLMQRMAAAPFGVQNFGELGGSSIRSTDPDYLALIAPYRKQGIA